ncbi:hypothetical protein GCM10017771_87700 [Streptomyces capitiformicae]|uniref:Uncharacterized protein n=1 Tax=Streptomyces capitiformicae TaxID=2014920 RepID=A0A918ZPX5_9ACTN|nr:hypothetical protein GCM10017771_87700 [Streptomyces capitiformicae]
MGAVDENGREADVSVELVEEDLDGVAGGWAPPPVTFPPPGSGGSGSGGPRPIISNGPPQAPSAPPRR